MTRFRLRFLLQEFDLAPGETLLGRSPDCQVTIEDPLVSRHHARVRLEGGVAVVEDLGSRNGVRVNGRAIKAPTELADGDRIRIGTQELVFSQLNTAQGSLSKRTGFLRNCGRCHTPYPEEMGTCPTCGASDVAEDDTLAGHSSDVSHNWTLQLLVDVVERALALDRLTDAERMLRRASASVDERLGGGAGVDGKQAKHLASCALRLARSQQSATWARWALETSAKLGSVPDVAAIECVGELPSAERATLTPLLEDVWRAAAARAAQLEPYEAAGLEALKALMRA